MASQTKTKQGRHFRLTPLAVGIGLVLGVCELQVVRAAENPGEPIGAEFRVNNTATGSQASPAVALDADGDFVVAWEGVGDIGVDYYGEPIIGAGIFARCYSNAGLPVDAEFPVDTSSQAAFPSVATDADGNFVVAWIVGVEFGDVYFRRYNDRCEARDSQRRQANSTTFFHSGPSVAMDGDGDFVVAWEGYDYYTNEIYARRYNNLGEEQDTSEFQVNTSANSTLAPSVAMDADGDFVVAWEGYDYYTNEIFARRYSADGTPQGGEFQINTSNGTTLDPSVAMDADGDFVVVWEGYEYTGTGPSEVIFARRYSADGTPQGDEFQVNTTTTNNQSAPSVALDADGDFVIAWDSYLQDGDALGIYAQRFAGPEDVDLSVMVTDDPDPVDPGGLLNYSFFVTNNHPIVTPTGVPAIDRAIGSSTGINTSHTLPEGVSLDAFSGTDWTCTQTARTARQVDCAFSGTLLPTTVTSADLTLSFETRAPAAADITTSVNVTGSQVDTDATNNTDSESTSVVSPDTQPEAFSFVDQTDVAPNTVVTSNPITVAGIDAPASISLLGVSGATYSINGGPFTDQAGTVANDAMVTVRQTSWSEFSTTTNATLVIGGITDTFSVTTAASSDSVAEEPDPVPVISNESPSSPAAAAEPTTTSGSSGGGCTLAGNRATAGGLGWLETFGLLFLALRRRKKC